MMPDIMTTEEAADYLQLGIDTVRRMARTGELRAAKIGHLWRFFRTDLDAWLSEGSRLRQRLEDEGLLMAMDEAKADPANRTSRPLEEVLKERGL